MTYKQFHTPFECNIHDLSKRELRSYFDWFLEIIPSRLIELHGAVVETPGFGDWVDDLRPASLSSLDEWFGGQVETRAITQEELERVKGNTSLPIESERELTDYTMSVAVDIGLYMSQVFLKNNAGLKWGQIFNKRDVNYGHPVLMGFGEAAFNPVLIPINIARSKKRVGTNSKSIFDIYCVWEGILHK